MKEIIEADTDPIKEMLRLRATFASTHTHKLFCFGFDNIHFMFYLNELGIENFSDVILVTEDKKQMRVQAS